MTYELNLDEILGEIGAAAYEAAALERVEMAQINKLIEILEVTKSIDETLIFLARQVARGYWGRRGMSSSAHRLFNLLKGRELEEAKVILGLFKWIYEAVDRSKPRHYRPPRTPSKDYTYELLRKCIYRGG